MGTLVWTRGRTFPLSRLESEEDGLEGLVDRRLGKPSPQRVSSRFSSSLRA